MKTSPPPPPVFEAARALRQGRLVIFPTETVYALAVNARRPNAINNLFRAKGRHLKKPLQLLIADDRDWAPFVSARALAPGIKKILGRLWPGPLTAVLPASRLGRRISVGGKIGIRMPDHHIAREILRSCGVPVAATSANMSGGPEPFHPRLIPAALRKKAKCVIMERGRTRLAGPSTVVDFTKKPPKVLRQGVLRLTFNPSSPISPLLSP